VNTATPSDIETLFDHYLAHGCPCRFPRFRATVGRNLKEIGAPDWELADVPGLLVAFDRRVPLDVQSRTPYVTEGSCKRCGAHVIRSGAPIFRDSFIERARITPGAQPDVGAEASGPVPVCGGLFHAAPGNVTQSENQRIQNAYPRLGPELWLAYMRELAS
jgi:hypothetical protein